MRHAERHPPPDASLSSASRQRSATMRAGLPMRSSAAPKQHCNVDRAAAERKQLVAPGASRHKVFRRHRANRARQDSARKEKQRCTLAVRSRAGIQRRPIAPRLCQGRRPKRTVQPASTRPRFPAINQHRAGRQQRCPMYRDLTAAPRSSRSSAGPSRACFASLRIASSRSGMAASDRFAFAQVRR